jgi:prepilin signal peptidase PulO-like enzyme (type II secretory pathway)
VIGLFLLGSCLGSFLNVVILRSIDALKANETSGGLGRRRLNVGGRSHCPHCHQQLRWWELVPILSFLWLRGKCHRCHHKISWQYPAVELAMGIITVALVLPLPTTLAAAAVSALHLIIASLLVVLFMVDLKTMLLPDNFVLAVLVIVILKKIIDYSQLPANYSLSRDFAGIAIGAGFLLCLWLVTRGKGIGLGDVKLMIPLGLLFGPLATTVLLFMAYSIGGALAIYLLLRKRATMKTALPFGPFLCGAALVVLLAPSLPMYLVTGLLGYNPWA